MDGRIDGPLALKTTTTTTTTECSEPRNVSYAVATPKIEGFVACATRPGSTLHGGVEIAAHSAWSTSFGQHFMKSPLKRLYFNETNMQTKVSAADWCTACPRSSTGLDKAFMAIQHACIAVANAGFPETFKQTQNGTARNVIHPF